MFLSIRVRFSNTPITCELNMRQWYQAFRHSFSTWGSVWRTPISINLVDVYCIKGRGIELSRLIYKLRATTFKNAFPVKNWLEHLRKTSTGLRSIICIGVTFASSHYYHQKQCEPLAQLVRFVPPDKTPLIRVTQTLVTLEGRFDQNSQNC